MKRYRPFLWRIRYIWHVNCHVHAIKFVLTWGIKVLSSNSQFKFPLISKMFRHVSWQNHAYYSFPQIFLIFSRQRRKYIESFLIHQFERGSHVMILENRNIIIPKRKFVFWVDEIHVIIPRMLIIMNRSWQNHWEEIHVVQFAFCHPITSNYEIIHCLRNISSMCFVVIGHKIVSWLDLVNELNPNIQIQF